MTDLATIAREAALHCEAKKHGFRQTQDGVVISFVLHPQEVPDKLATAVLGTRYQLVLVELDDNDEPKDHRADTRLTQRASILCGEKVFQTFLSELLPLDWQQATGSHEERAATVLRGFCKVQSRRDIVPGSAAAAAFENLLGKFIGWKRGL